MVDASGIPRRVTAATAAQSVKDLTRTVEQQGSARRLESASIGKAGAGQVFLASDGQRFVDKDGIERIRFRTADGGADFDGPVSIQGPLTLRPGSIENDSLASPIATGSAGLTQQGFAIGSSPGVFAAQEIRIPDGYSRALVMNGVSGAGWNNNSTPGYLMVSSVINGVGGGEVPAVANASGSASATAFAVRTLEGLRAGGVITVGTRLRADNGAWAPNNANTAHTNALVLFLR